MLHVISRAKTALRHTQSDIYKNIFIDFFLVGTFVVRIFAA
jgi:hypothetical protein